MDMQRSDGRDGGKGEGGEGKGRERGGESYEAAVILARSALSL